MNYEGMSHEELARIADGLLVIKGSPLVSEADRAAAAAEYEVLNEAARVKNKRDQQLIIGEASIGSQNGRAY